LSVGAHTGRVTKAGMIKTVLPVLKQRALEIERFCIAPIIRAGGSRRPGCAR
jgi:hypothetical protein